MKIYKMTAQSTFGPGQKLALDATQIAGREHLLESDRKAVKGKRFLVTAVALLEFKSGEEIGLEDLPKNLIGIAIDRDEADKAAKEAAAAESLAKKKQDEADQAAAAKKAADEAAKLLADARASAEELVQTAVKYLAEHVETISAGQKAELESAIALVTDALKTENIEEIEAAADALDEAGDKVAQELAAKASEQAGGNSEAQAAQQGA